MKKLSLFIALVLLFVGLCACEDTDSTDDGTESGIVAAETWIVSSPDKKLNIEIILDDYGALYYSVTKNNVDIVNESALGFVLEEEDLTEMLSLESIETNVVNVSYDNISGKSSHVEDTCNEVILKFRGYYYFLTLTMRAYDDGYAFKYGIDATDGSTGEVHVVEETSQFALPADSYTWIQAYKPLSQNGTFFAYEESYTKRKASNIYGKTVSLPMIYRAGKSDVYSLITESGLIGSGYYGSMLKAIEDGSTILQTVHTPAGIAENDNNITYPFVSPWRVGITGSLKEVTESELVEKVYDNIDYWKPENYDELSSEEQEIYNYDWVDADVTAWNWLSYVYEKIPQNNWELQRKYVDLAADMGWKYTLLDGGWNDNFDVKKFNDFMTYADSKGIKVVVWCNALNDFGNGNRALLESKLDYWSSLGIDGIKIDFFDGQNAKGQTHQGEDIETIKWYEAIYQECAKRKMIVNCHGSNKPTGERRLYPNVINREGVKGNEMFSVVTCQDNVNALFTRAVVGPSDYTPVVYPKGTVVTVGHQLALTVLYESGSPSMADFEDAYYNNDLKAYFQGLPALWDEMYFISGELDGYFVCARRSGDDWYVAGINASDTLEFAIDLSFLDSNATYTGYLYKDGDDLSNQDDFIVSTLSSINSTSTEYIEVEHNGGFVLKLTKNN